MSFGPLEIILIIAVIALLFGARKLPELGKGFGQGIREFKREVRDETVTTQTVVTDVPSQPLPTEGSVSQPAVTRTTVTTEERR